MGGTRGGVPPIGVAAGLSRPGASPRCRLSGVVRVTRAGRVPVNRPVDSGGLRPTRPAGVSRTAGGDAAPAVAHRVARRALSSAGRNRHPTPSHATPRGGAVAAPTPPAVQPPHHRISPPPPSRQCPPSPPVRTDGGVHPEWTTRPTNLPRQPWWGQGEGVCSNNQGGRPPRRAGRGPAALWRAGPGPEGVWRGEHVQCTAGLRHNTPSPFHRHATVGGLLVEARGAAVSATPPLPRPHGAPSPAPPLALSVWIPPHWQWARVPPPPRQLVPPCNAVGRSDPPCSHHARTTPARQAFPFSPHPPLSLSFPLSGDRRAVTGPSSALGRGYLSTLPTTHGAERVRGRVPIAHGVRSCAQRRDRRG